MVEGFFILGGVLGMVSVIAFWGHAAANYQRMRANALADDLATLRHHIITSELTGTALPTDVIVSIVGKRKSLANEESVRSSGLHRNDEIPFD